MNSQRVSGIIIMVLAALLILGYLMTNSTINNLKLENKRLVKKVNQIELLNEKTTTPAEENNEKKEKPVQTEDNSSRVQELTSLTAFNEDFVKHLNINDDIEKNNEFLKSISSGEAQGYLKENQYIFESNVKTTEEKESHDHKEGYETADVVMSTTDIQSYFNYMADGTIVGNTTYKVNSTTEVEGKEDTTVGNFIMKASYIKDGAEWKVNNIYGIAPVSDQSADTLFKK